MKEVFLFCFIPFVLIQTIAGEATLVIQGTQNNELTIKEGTDAYITCRVTGATETWSVKWFNEDGNEVTNRVADPAQNPHIRPGTNYNKLGLRSIKEGDAGRYTCKAELDGQPEMSALFQLKVEATLKFTNCPPIQNGLIGSSHAIKCTASIDGKDLHIYWEKNDQEIATNDPRYRSDETSLTVLNVTTQDEGSYSLIATIGQEPSINKKTIDFFAVERPRFVSPIQEQQAIVGRDVDLFCTAAGRPMPSIIQWKKQGSSNEITGTGRLTVSDGIRDNNGVQKILSIKKVIREDKGTYECTAFGEQVDGQDLTATQPITLLVQIPPTIELPVPPKGVEGRGQTISCVGLGDPAPRMVWMKEGTNKQYFKGEHDEKKILVKESTERLPSGDYRVSFNITFREVEGDNAGNYICKGMNNAGNDSKTVEFIVDYKPKPVEPESQFYTWSPPRSTGFTETAMKCKVRSNPAPAFAWLKDGVQISDSQPFYGISNKKDPEDKDDDHISMSTLTVKYNGQNPEVIGMYTCKPVNYVGEELIQMALVKAELPPKPQVEIFQREASDYIFYLMEQTVQGPEITRFKVVYSRTADGDGGTMTQEVPRETRPSVDSDRKYTELRIENLEENTEYSYTFYAISPVGESHGYELTERTPQIREPGVVDILTDANVPTSTIIRIRWNRPPTGGAPILKYKVKYQRVEVKKELENAAQASTGKGYELLRPIDTERVVDNIKNDQYELKGLLPDTFYMLTVEAKNLKGWGTPGTKIIKTANAEEISGAATDSGSGGGLSTGAIVGIVIAIFFILLIIVDVTCYFKNSCGILMSIKEKVTGSRGDEGYSAAKTDDVENLAKKDELTEEAKAAEEGEVADEEKKEPLLSEEQKVDTVDEGETKPEEKEMEPEEKEAKPEETKTEETPAAETKEEAPATEETTQPTENQVPEKPAE